MRRGVLLDRDGTLIDVVRDAETGVVTTAFHPDQLRLLPGVVAGLDELARAGFVLAIATNQPGAAKGQIPRAAIERTNEALVELLARQGIRIAALEACLHHPEGGPGGDAALVMACECRKPAPGMLLRLVERLRLDPTATWMIGDTDHDVRAARAAGLSAGLLLDAQRCPVCPLRGRDVSAADATGPTLDVLARAILAPPAA